MIWHVEGELGQIYESFLMPAQESRLHSYMYLEMLIDVLVYLTIQVVGTWVSVVPLVFWDLP